MTREMLSRIVAAVFIALVAAYGLHAVMEAKFYRVQAESAEACRAHELQVLDHGYTEDAVLAVMYGVAYVAVVEATAYAFRGGWRKPAGM